MKRNIKIVALLIVFFIAVIGAIILFKKPREKSGELSIVATNFPAYDFARAVVGDTTDIRMLVKPGAETHDFEPTPQDMIDIQNSKLFIYTGGESDEWVKDILNNIDTDKTRLFKMMDVVEIKKEEVVEGMEIEDEEDGGDGELDEHVWTSLLNASKIITNIKDILIEISPEHKNVYEENVKKYLDILTSLDAKFREIVNTGNRKTLIFGDRFPLGYFVDDYGLLYFAAFPGCSEQTEASSQTIAFLIDKVRSEKIPVVLKNEMSSGKIAQTIADETGAKVLTFNSAHNISAEDFKNGLTYAKIMEGNLDVLREALR